MTQNYEAQTPIGGRKHEGKTKFKSKFAESLQNIYTFSACPLRGSRDACDEEISEKEDVEDDGREESLLGSVSVCNKELRDDEKLERHNTDSNCEVGIITSLRIIIQSSELDQICHLQCNFKGF